MKKLKSLFSEIIKYLISGGVAFIIDVSTLYCLTEFLKLHYYFSVIIAFAFGLITVYFLNTKWVFVYHSQKSKKKEFILFLLITIDGLCLNLILISFFTEIINIYYIVSKLLVTIIVLFWNYSARKYFLFNKSEVR